MPTSKHVLVLANSVKHWPGVCIAGREIAAIGGQPGIGPWVRPVSSHGEGELSPSETRLIDGTQPAVFDVVEVHLLHAVADPLQPENWLIDSARRWRRLKEEHQPDLASLREEPPNLWTQPGERTDRVAAEYLSRAPVQQSLYLIHVDRVAVSFEWREWEGTYRQRRRALFRYHGTEYALNITDPQFSERHRERFPAKGEPAVTFEVQPPGGCHLCVSLAPEFGGYHYKVVATIIESL